MNTDAEILNKIPAKQINLRVLFLRNTLDCIAWARTQGDTWLTQFGQREWLWSAATYTQ